MKSSTVHWKAWLMLASLSLIWGSSFILIKRGLTGFAPEQLAILRLSISALAFLPVAIRHLPRYDRKKTIPLALVGLLGSAIPALLFAIAQTALPSGIAGILNSMTPFFALIIGILWFGQSWRWMRIIGVVLGMAGASSLILLGSDTDLGAEGLHVRYSLLIVLATMCYATSVNIVKRYLQDTPSLHISAFSFAIVGIPISLAIVPSGIPETLAHNPGAWAALGYIAILALAGTVLSTVIFYRLVQITNVVFSSSVAYLIPIVALLWASFDMEPVSFYQILGMGLILSGVYLTRR